MVKEANLVAQSPALKRDQFIKQLEKRVGELERASRAEGPIKMEVRG
jgi:hypothetical protein